MGIQTIVHGRILLQGDTKKTVSFIRSLGDDDKYPFIETKMFGIDAIDAYHYQEPVIGFTATYKRLELDLDNFIFKFEHILRNISFDTAKIQVETEFYGNCNLFWDSKYQKTSHKKSDELYETNEWFFGFGYRNRWGRLELPDNHIPGFKFKYPITPDPAMITKLEDIIKSSGFDGEKIYIGDYVKSLPDKKIPAFELALISLNIKGQIDYGHDEQDLWIKAN